MRWHRALGSFTVAQGFRLLRRAESLGQRRHRSRVAEAVENKTTRPAHQQHALKDSQTKGKYNFAFFPLQSDLYCIAVFERVMSNQDPSETLHIFPAET